MIDNLVRWGIESPNDPLLPQALVSSFEVSFGGLGSFVDDLGRPWSGGNPRSSA